MTVALIRALAGYLDEPMTPGEVAALACEIEIVQLGMPIGRQDQYASAFGGVNAISFARDGVAVAPLRLRPAALTALNARLLLFFTGQTRHSSQILTQQRRDSKRKPATVESLHRIKALASEIRDALLAEDFDGLGALLDEGWREKKRLSPAISSGAIDEWYAQARRAGALGGKITGAGGGGFLLLYCPPERQAEVRRTMARLGLSELTFTFDSLGGMTLPVAALGL
jgi:D-glycero-alpha-D-manno-heptose-7-phosphate kinase